MRKFLHVWSRKSGSPRFALLQLPIPGEPEIGSNAAQRACVAWRIQRRFTDATRKFCGDSMMPELRAQKSVPW
jgi:hypothetical protein